MDWYTKAQDKQAASGYCQWTPEDNPDQPSENPQEELGFEEEMEDASGEQEVDQIVSKHGFELRMVPFHDAGPVPIVYSNGKPVYVLDDLVYPQLKDPQDWIDSIGDLSLHQYVEMPDFSESFWSGVYSGEIRYHGTAKDRVKDIMIEGLTRRAETRGISNRWDSSGIFTSADYYTAAERYDVVLEINVGAMKADGYMPQVRGEEPLQDEEAKSALASLIGYDEYVRNEYSSDGLAEDTVVFLDTIPPKYLKTSN